MRAAVREIGYCFPTAIVSGRCKDKVIHSHSTEQKVNYADMRQHPYFEDALFFSALHFQCIYFLLDMQVYEFVKLRNVYYAGSHGMDISTPSGSSKCEDQKHQIKGVDEKVFIYVSLLSVLCCAYCLDKTTS